MTKKNISWMILGIGILCIYISMGTVLNNTSTMGAWDRTEEVIQNDVINTVEEGVAVIEEELLIIEDEEVPGGKAPSNLAVVDKLVIFYLGAILLTGLGLMGTIISK